MNYIKGYPLKDTCLEYYLMFYKGPWMDTMSQKEWDNLTDYQIGMKLYGNFDIKTRVKITSAMTRLKKKNSIESKYSRVIFTRDD